MVISKITTYAVFTKRLSSGAHKREIKPVEITIFHRNLPMPAKLRAIGKPLELILLGDREADR